MDMKDSANDRECRVLCMHSMRISAIRRRSIMAEEHCKSERDGRDPGLDADVAPVV